MNATPLHQKRHPRRGRAQAQLEKRAERQDMRIEWIPPDKLNPYENNPRINDAAVPKVAESIRMFGFRNPIIVDADNTIVCGHTRWKAARRLKMEMVPCIRADGLTESQIRAFRLVDNKTNEFAEWDVGKLSEEMLAMPDMDLSMFDFNDIDEVLDGIIPKEAEEDDFDEDEETDEHGVDAGDVWKMGAHRLICGDATSAADMEKLMASCGKGIVADMLLTDPPYNVDYEGKTKKRMKLTNDSMCGDVFNQFLTSAFSNAQSHMRAGAMFFVWYASKEHINFETSLRSSGLDVRQVLIWNKNSFVLGRQDFHWKHEPCMYGWKAGTHKWRGDRKQSTVLDFDRPTKSEEHPTMKPVKLFAYQIQCATANDDIVLDPFAGSGTSVIASEELGRRCCAMEIDAHYCDVILSRWEKLTGKDAVRQK